MAGALEIKYWLPQSGGDVHGGNGIGDSNYASDCLRYMDLIGQDKPLPDSD